MKQHREQKELNLPWSFSQVKLYIIQRQFLFDNLHLIHTACLPLLCPCIFWNCWLKHKIAPIITIILLLDFTRFGPNCVNSLQWARWLSYPTDMTVCSQPWYQRDHLQQRYIWEERGLGEMRLWAVIRAANDLRQIVTLWAAELMQEEVEKKWINKVKKWKIKKSLM